eukprot:c21286_g1_i1 orf=388-1695(-)
MGLCMSIEEKSLQEEYGSEVLVTRKERKRLAMEVLSAERKAAQLLSEMPGRLCSNGATKSCCLHTKQGCKGTNQDCMLAWEGFASEEKSVFCGVFDGHGPNGHLVASKVRDCLPSLLTLPLEGCNTPHHHIHKPIKIININDPDKDVDDQHSKTADAVDEEDEGSVWIDERFTAAFHKMDERLKNHPKLSCMSSGTTAVAMLVQGNDLVVGNVGDSRAILVTQQNGVLVAHQLTVDLKPDSPGEIERIKECQGRVFALDDELHIARLWVPHANTPGLAMSRAFGDFCLKEYGLIATPQISHRKLTEDDEFIVLATDGVWDVLSNNQVMDAVLSATCKEEAAKCVVEAAINMWKQRNLHTRIDDCAVVCHFLKDKLSPSKTSKKLKAKEVSQDDANHGDDNLQKGETITQLIRYDTLVTTENSSSLPLSLPLERGV